MTLTAELLAEWRELEKELRAICVIQDDPATLERNQAGLAAIRQKIEDKLLDLALHRLIPALLDEQIVVVVESGIAHTVYCTNPEAKVQIADLDIDMLDDEEAEALALIAEARDALTEVY